MKRELSWMAALGTVALSGAAAAQTATPSAPAQALRVCGNPDNLPFSNSKLEGFENRIADIIAAELGVPVVYIWHAQRRAFVRRTLNAGRCDLVMGAPVGLQALITTKPYYRSTYVFVTRKDFSFLRSVLIFASIAALIFAIASIALGFSVSSLFFWAMIVLTGGYILYDTSNVLHHYSERHYVLAAIQLFASFATLLWYVLRLLSRRR